MKQSLTKLYTLTILLFLVSMYGVKAQSASISGPSPSGTINVGDTRTFSVGVSGAQSVVNINWSSSSNYTIVSGQGTSSAQIRFLSVGNVTVRATVVIMPSFQSLYPSRTVSVNGTVVGPVSITSGPTSRCEGGGSSDYNASASNANSYSWSLSPSSAGSINSSTGLVSWNSNFSGTATVSVTAFGDNNSSSSTSRSVTVRDVPGTPPPISASNSSLCSGQSTSITLAGSALGIQYTLFKNGTSVGSRTSTAFGQQLSWSNMTAGSYYVRASNPSNTCGFGPANSTITVSSQQGLGSNIVLNNGGTSTRCQGSGTTPFNVTGGSSGNTYQWSVSGSGNTISGSGRNATVTWSPSFGGSTATISVVVTSQCGTSTTRTRSVAVDPATSAPPPLSASEATICSGSSTTLTLAGSALGVQYTLYRNGSSVSSQTSTQFGQQLSWSVSSGGSYNVRANDPGTSCGLGPAGNTVNITSQQGLGSNIVLNNEGASTRCQGSGTTGFNVTGGSSSNTYQWSVSGGGNTISGSGRDATVTWSPSFGGSTATISVVVTSQCGTSTTRTRSVVVDPASSAPPPLSASETTICSGSSTNLTLAGSALGVQYTLYRNGTSVGSQTSTQFGEQLSWSVSSAGAYNVRANDPSSSCGLGPAGNTVNITVQQGLGSNITLNNEGASTRCEGSGTQEFNVTGGSSSNTYQWSVSGGGNTIAGSGRDATVTWSPSFGGSTATISVVVTSQCGTSTTRTSSVVVNPSPSAPPPLSAEDTTICSDSSTTLTLAGSALGINYHLYKNGVSQGFQTSTAFGQQLSWSNITAGSYYLRTSDPTNSCGQGPAGNTVAITSLQGLGSNITLNNEGASTRCQGSGTTNFNITGGSNSNTYQWSISAGSSTINDTGRNATIDWSSSFGNSTATITVVVTSECGDSTTLSESIFVNPLPGAPPPLNASSETFCAGGFTTLSLAGSARDVSYALYRGTTLVGTQVSSEFGEQLSWDVSTAGDYYVITPDQGNSCGSSPPTDSVTITEVTPTTLQITSVPADLTNICAGTPVTLTVNGTNATWNDTERATSITVTPLAGGPTTYTVTANEENCGLVRTAQITITPVTSIAWYPDSDGDGLGDRFGTPFLSCTSPGSGWADNNNDFCPDSFGTLGNSGCPPGEIVENRNWITSKAYDIDGTLKASSKMYYNDLGKLQQSQSLDIETNRTWASHVLYDSHGRPAIQSLSAPNGLQGSFTYQPDFMRNGSNQTYGSIDFESNLNNPSPVGDNVNTLGWYYSDQNTDTFYAGNDYQDITQYPFSRTLYSKLNPGSIWRVLGGNKPDMDADGSTANDVWPQAYSFTMPISDELSLNVAFGETSYRNTQATKTISRDVHGVENVVFTDLEGKVLAAARSGEGPISGNMSIPIGEQGYVDVHLPQGITGLSTTNNNAVKVFSLIGDVELLIPLSALPSGFYRVAVSNPENYTPGSISVTYRVNYYDYSLNEYDEADRLVRSYQPLGTTKATKPMTEYEYNALGQLVHTKSPDEGEAWFRYREDGQIRYSQNSKQRDPNGDGNFSDAEFSYTNYDTFGRPIESGVVVSTAFASIDPDTDATPSGTKKEQQFTTYDIGDDAALATALGSRASNYPSQSFVAGNVAFTSNDQSKTWYAYDIYGRVKWLVQEIQNMSSNPEERTKTLDYEYHPTTGLVTRVIYQKGVASEQFIHKYTYDVQDQLTLVETSVDGTNYTTQATYEYYETGGLKRKEIAGVQGVDYVYNLEGQLKSINHPGLNAANDPGNDSNDLFGMQFDYYNNDFARNVPNLANSPYGTNQLNGNIKGIRWNNAYPLTNAGEYVYSYDRNYWLTGADYNPGVMGSGGMAIPPNLEDNNTYTGSTTASLEATERVRLTDGFHAQNGTTVTVGINPNNDAFSDGDYDVTGIAYDANGNIRSLIRNKGSQNGDNAMDNLSYTYKTNPQDGPNQLIQVSDAAGDVAGAEDIGTQAPNNYVYNAIGELVNNAVEGISYSYNASGLVTEVKKNTLLLVKFYYNDRNHRVRKETFNSSGVAIANTYYVRDVSGSIMTIYNETDIREQPIYGNDRIGIAYTGQNAAKSYVYELTDHLGNVRALFTKSGTEAIDKGYTDYYPFGMPMPNRSLLSAEGYRYAFQGQEKDPETGKEAFELRLWDARIGRWLTTDPAGQYISPYLGMGNDPINGIDPDGGWRWKLFAKWARNKAIKAGLNPGELYKSGKEWGFNTSSVTDGFTTDADATAIFNFTDAWTNSIPATITEASNLTKFDFWRRSEPKNNTEALAQIGVELTYGSAENVYTIFSGGRKFNGTQLVGDHRTNAGVDGFVTAATAGFGYAAKTGFKVLKSSGKLFNQFAKSTKGLFTGPNHAKLRSQAYQRMLKMHKNRIDGLNKEVRRIFDFWKKGSENVSAIDTVTDDK